MACVYLNGPGQLDPGQTASYTAGVNSWCGSQPGYITWSIEGDGAIVSQSDISVDLKKSSGPSTVQVRAANVSYGSFTLTASHPYYGSASKTVTVGTPPPVVPNVNLRASAAPGGVLITWDSSAIPANAVRCELFIQHYRLGGGVEDERTVLVGGGSYLDRQHAIGTNGLSRVTYRLTVFDAHDNVIPITNNSAGIFGDDRYKLDIALE